jgi:hypothetical protein
VCARSIRHRALSLSDVKNSTTSEWMCFLVFSLLSAQTCLYWTFFSVVSILVWSSKCITMCMTLLHRNGRGFWFYTPDRCSAVSVNLREILF